MKLNLKSKLDKLVLNTFYIFLITLGIFIFLELGTRIFIAYNTTSPNRMSVTSKAYSYFDWRERFFVDKKKPGGDFRYEAYSAWKHTDKNSDLINIVDGYRVTWEPEAATGKEDFIIFMFGGSTTFGIESPDDLTIASILAKKLNKSSSRYRYVIKNYGVSGFVNDQEVHLLMKLLGKGKRPDAVIFYDGLNDIQTKVGLGREHFLIVGYQKKLFTPRNWRDRIRNYAYRSQLVLLLSNRPSMIHRLFPLINDRATLRKNAESMLAEYEENVRLTKALGEEYGFRRIHFWGPSMFNTGKKLTPEESSRVSLPIDLYDANQLAHDIVAEVAVEKSFFEAAKVIDIHNALDNVTETIFVDSNHVTPIGNEAVASAMLPSISREF